MAVLRLALSALFDFDIWLVVAPLALLPSRRQSDGAAAVAVYALALFAVVVASFHVDNVGVPEPRQSGRSGVEPDHPSDRVASSRQQHERAIVVPASWREGSPRDAR